MNNQQTTDNPVLVADHVCYAYGEKNHRLSILEQLNFSVFPQDRIAIIGASGTGKSTLLHVLGGLDTPQSGTVTLQGKHFAGKPQPSPKTQGMMRNQHLGFVYQFHHLLPEFSALENVMMPLLARKTNRHDATTAAKTLLNKVGVGNRYLHKPAKLSGGERQRVAIARAMVTNPDCILADEPTGNLDQETAGAVIQLLFDLQQTENTALVIVTHDMDIARNMDTVYRLENKQLNRL